jgi:acyl-CoA thioesterase-1
MIRTIVCGIVICSVTANAMVTTAAPRRRQAKSQLVKHLESGKPQVVVAYGTSLTSSGAWVKQLDDVLEKQFPGLATVINSGGSGKWSNWGVQNLNELVIQKKPDAVFLEFCINDSVARFNCSVRQSKANLDVMINRILKENPKCEIILMTMTPGNKYPVGHASHRRNIGVYYDMVRFVAMKRRIGLVDHYPNWQAMQSTNRALFQKYVPDTIHPTAAGCSKVVTPEIIKTLGIHAKPGG